jgi:hypothetical protein
MLSTPRITDHSMDSTRVGQYLINGFLDAFFIGDIGLQGEELVGVARGDFGEFVAWGADVDGVDACGAVGEAAVCYSEADSWVGVLVEVWEG